MSKLTALRKFFIGETRAEMLARRGLTEDELARQREMKRAANEQAEKASRGWVWWVVGGLLVSGLVRLLASAECNW